MNKADLDTAQYHLQEFITIMKKIEAHKIPKRKSKYSAAIDKALAGRAATRFKQKP